MEIINRLNVGKLNEEESNGRIPNTIYEKPVDKKAVVE